MNNADTTTQVINAARQNRINAVLKPFLKSLPKTVRVAYAAALTSLSWKQESEGVLSAESLAESMKTFESPAAMLASSKPEKQKAEIDPELAAKQAEINAAVKPVLDSLSKSQRTVYAGAITSLAWRMMADHCLTADNLRKHVDEASSVDEIKNLYRVPGSEVSPEQEARQNAVTAVLKPVMKSLSKVVKRAHAATITKITWQLEKDGRLSESNLREEIAGLTVEAAA